jgi:hypothetical protein
MNATNALNARHAGEADVGEQNVGRIAANLRECLLHGIVLTANLEFRRATYQKAQPFAGDTLIFDERHANGLRHVCSLGLESP